MDLKDYKSVMHVFLRQNIVSVNVFKFLEKNEKIFERITISEKNASFKDKKSCNYYFVHSIASKYLKVEFHLTCWQNLNCRCNINTIWLKIANRREIESFLRTLKWMCHTFLSFFGELERLCSNLQFCGSIIRTCS